MIKKAVLIILCALILCMPISANDGTAPEPDLSGFSARYIPPDLLPYITGSFGALSGEYYADKNEYILTATKQSIDPMVSVDLTSLAPISADEYKYIVMLLRSSRDSGRAGIFYYAGEDGYAAAERYRSVELGEVWQYHIVDLSEAYRWSGQINGFRFDPYDNTTVGEGESVSLGGILFCKTLEEAEWACGGWLPDGIYESYADHLAAKEETEHPDTEKVPEESPEESFGSAWGYVFIPCLLIFVSGIIIGITRKKKEHR